MVEIIWTKDAADDFESAVEYIALDSSYYGELFASDLLNCIENLTWFPEMGRVVPEANETHLREILFGNYRIVYKVSYVAVEIVAIHHQARIYNPNQISGKEL